MALCNRLGLKLAKSVGLRCLGTQAAPAVQVQEDAPQPFRTKESNPANHNEQHLGKFYTVPASDVAPMLGNSDLPLSRLKKDIKTFAEFSILIRKPALEIMSYLSKTDYSKPVNKYVIFGEDGTGKSISLIHVLHYGYATKKLIVYVPWLQDWYRFPSECANSSTKEGLVDLPIEAAKFLFSFKFMNAAILSETDLRLSKTYKWGADDTFQEGAPITDIINYGIDRIKYACDIVAVLFDEIKLATTAGKCNTLVAIDGFNGFYSQLTRVRNDNKEYMPASKISLTHAFLNLTKSDWCNGQIVVTVDLRATKEYRESYLPRYLLTKEGFEHLDPFLPVGVENYSQDEFDTVIDYYKNRKWIRSMTPEAQKELQLICGSNPYKLMDYCRTL